MPYDLRQRAALGALALTVSIAPLAAQHPLAASVDSVARTIAAQWNVPGFSVAVVRNDSVLLVQGYGVRALSGGAAVDANTAFYIASASKAFTAMAIGAMADDGLVRGTDRVTRALPGFRLADSSASAELTLLDLLAHRTATPRADLLLFSGLSDSAFIARLSAMPVVPTLRGRIAYSNQMYQVASTLVSQVTKRPFPDYVESRLLAPLGMTASNARGVAGPRGGNAATPHGWVDGSIRALDPLTRAPYGGGAINTTAQDLTAWMRMVLAGGTLDGKRVISTNFTRAMVTPLTLGSPITALPGATLAAYGLGGYLQDFRGSLAYAAIGQGEGWSTAIFLLPEARIGVAVLANMQGTLLPQVVGASVLDRALGLPARDWAALYRSIDGSMRAPRDQAVAGAPVRTAEMTLQNPLYGALSIAGPPAAREVRYGPELRGTLTATADTLWQIRWTNPAVRAVLGSSPLRVRVERDSVREASLDIGQGPIRFRATPDARP